MGSLLNINMSLDPEIINDIAIELGVDPAFVEKDWYAVQVLKSLATHQSDEITTIFSGGTSLSKAHGLIQRFSEDLDFRCLYINESSGNKRKSIRRDYRASILTSVKGVDSITLENDNVLAASNYIKFPLAYPQNHSSHASLRPHLEVEFSFTQPRLVPELKPVQSLVSTFTNGKPEARILCLSPIETGADKISALTWRVLRRDRALEGDDPTMIRHLHDLAALKPLLIGNQDMFAGTALESFEQDQQSGRRETDAGFYKSMEMALDALSSDSLYKTEYSQFVDAMSYADDGERIDFSEAKDNFAELIALFK
ncbi:nucleotidyl transferase AbiEii/AbiGii toxin family protein [Alkalimarinus alittae]|uniref:Nucleotidyl transferase AbiEii/AbiGii toxin family protein n=1 Tax=Alkalimarinus alittae TaxID=2961619 RepID=A0ABY6N4A7_9ALTE|nr:nucleotidyl transferase AbiEii/AbiGii toxin family protein [Alkalimarinus alittae]UZE96933.1 nucleotidyl transferase AbiEii/AbiGii toxin family protein [Alkalimarinus alittae]